MGLLDNLGGALKGVVGQVETAAGPALIDAALAKTSYGSLQGLIDKLKSGGLNEQVKSWLDGKAVPVTAEQLRAALGNEQVKHLADKFGLPVDSVLNLLSEHLASVASKAN
jgi:uncharacterized protein YidB (DUF937 family)